MDNYISSSRLDRFIEHEGKRWSDRNLELVVAWRGRQKNRRGGIRGRLQVIPKHIHDCEIVRRHRKDDTWESKRREGIGSYARIPVRIVAIRIGIEVHNTRIAGIDREKGGVRGECSALICGCEREEVQ